MIRQFLMGSAAVRAPENDQGAEDDADPDVMDTDEGAAEGDDGLDEDADDTDEDVGEDQEDDLGPAPEPAPAASRGSQRIQSLANENARLREEVEAIRRERQDAERQRQQQEFSRQEQERLEMMSPEERIEYRVNQRLAQVEFRSWDSNDAVKFTALANGNPAVATIADEVEATFQERVRNGSPVDRSTIAAFLIGQKALAKAPRAKAAGRRASETGRERNTARPTNGRGSSPSGGRQRLSEAEARRQRLEGLDI